MIKKGIIVGININNTVLETEYTNEGTLFSIECSKEDYVKYQSYII